MPNVRNESCMKMFFIFCRETRARKIPFWQQIENSWGSFGPWAHQNIFATTSSSEIVVAPHVELIRRRIPSLRAVIGIHSRISNACAFCSLLELSRKDLQCQHRHQIRQQHVGCKVNIQHSPVIVIDERKDFPREEGKWWKWAPAQHPCAPHDDDDAVFLTFLFRNPIQSGFCWCWKGKTDNRVLSCSIEARLLTSSCGSANSGFSFHFLVPFSLALCVKSMDFSAVVKLLIFVGRTKGIHSSAPTNICGLRAQPSSQGYFTQNPLDYKKWTNCALIVRLSFHLPRLTVKSCWIFLLPEWKLRRVLSYLTIVRINIPPLWLCQLRFYSNREAMKRAFYSTWMTLNDPFKCVWLWHYFYIIKWKSCWKNFFLVCQLVVVRPWRG